MPMTPVLRTAFGARVMIINISADPVAADRLSEPRGPSTNPNEGSLMPTPVIVFDFSTSTVTTVSPAVERDMAVSAAVKAAAGKP